MNLQLSPSVMRTRKAISCGAALSAAWLILLAAPVSSDENPPTNPDAIDRGHEWIDPAGRHWFVDEIGFAYYVVFDRGVPRRIYRQPLEQALAWELQNHLVKLGLPDARAPRLASGIDVAGTKWHRDELGYVFYDIVGRDVLIRVRPEPDPERRELATIVRRNLDAVDWPSAAAMAARNAVIRAMNGAHSDSLQFAEAPARNRFPAPTDAGTRESLLRSLVSAAVIQRLNGLQLSPSREEVQSFERIIAAGIEDAILQAFNEFSQPGNTKDATVESEKAASPQLPRPSGRLPAEDARRANKSSTSDARPQDKPPLMSITLRRAFGNHYSGDWYEPEIRAKYWLGHVVTSGWVVGDGFIKQLDAGEEYLVLNPRANPDVSEVWMNLELKYARCRYAATAQQAVKIFENREVLETE